jgi:hypothetical protein
MSDFKEPEIVINGERLSPGAAMTLRVALGSFGMSLDVDGLGQDEHGRYMLAAYQAHIKTIYGLMHGK